MSVSNRAHLVVLSILVLSTKAEHDSSKLCNMDTENLPQSYNPSLDLELVVNDIQLCLSLLFQRTLSYHEKQCNHILFYETPLLIIAGFLAFVITGVLVTICVAVFIRLIGNFRSYIRFDVIDRPWFRAPSSWPRFTSLNYPHLIQLAQDRVCEFSSSFRPVDGFCGDDKSPLTELKLIKHLLLVLACSKSRKFLVTRAAKQQRVKVSNSEEGGKKWLKTKEEKLASILRQIPYLDEAKYRSVWHLPTIIHPPGDSHVFTLPQQPAIHCEYKHRDERSLLAQALHELDFERILPAVLSVAVGRKGDDQLLTVWDVLCPHKIEYLHETKRESYLKRVATYMSRGYVWISIQKSRDLPEGCSAAVYTKK